MTYQTLDYKYEHCKQTAPNVLEVMLNQHADRLPVAAKLS
jgi:hypothetical protein